MLRATVSYKSTGWLSWWKDTIYISNDCLATFLQCYRVHSIWSLTEMRCEKGECAGKKLSNLWDRMCRSPERSSLCGKHDEETSFVRPREQTLLEDSSICIKQRGFFWKTHEIEMSGDEAKVVSAFVHFNIKMQFICWCVLPSRTYFPIPNFWGAANGTVRTNKASDIFI